MYFYKLLLILIRYMAGHAKFIFEQNILKDVIYMKNSNPNLI